MVATPKIESEDPVTGLPVKQFAFRGSGGLRLAAWRREPGGRPAAVVAFAHGFTAYANAYIDVLRALTAAGMLVYALDHRGHGYSEGKRGSLDHFDLLVDDFERLVSIARAEAPGLPIFTVGHSMGGLVVARHGFRYQEGLAGIVPISAAFVVGEGKSAFQISLLMWLSRLLPNLPAIGDNPAPPDEPAEPEAPQHRGRDMLTYQGKVRLNIARELYLGGRDALKHAHEWRLPLLLQHGTADTVTMPSGSELAFERASSPDRTLELWPDRQHNLITDEGWEEPVQHIVDWIQNRT